MAEPGGKVIRLRFRPDPPSDGVLEMEGETASVRIQPPDWEEALRLLKRINLLTTPSGVRVSSLVTADGFEPWWFVQDRLYRFVLLPFTQHRELLERLPQAGRVQLVDAPSSLKRVASSLSSKPGFPVFLDEKGREMGERKRRGGSGLRMGPLGLARLLASAFALLIFRWGRRDTVLYIIDQVSPGLDHDFRLSPLYAELRRRGYRVAEYAHTLSPRQALANSIRRRRAVVFLESLDDWARLSELSSQSPLAGVPTELGSLEDRLLWAVASEVLLWCSVAGARYRLLCSALRFQGATRAIIFDDNRHNHELVAACRSLGIKVLGFQHGLFNQYHAGTMAYGFGAARRHAFDLYGVWGPLFKERLLAVGNLHPQEAVFVSGPVRSPDTSLDGLLPPEIRPPSRRPRVLVVSEPIARKQEVAPYLARLSLDPRYEICLKLRPGEALAGISAYGLRPQAVRLLQTKTVYDALREADVVLGTYSSVLYEAALALRPTVWMRTSMAYGRELEEEGLCERADSPEAIGLAVERALQLPPEELARRRARIWGGNPGNGAARLLDAAEGRLWAPPGKDHRGRPAKRRGANDSEGRQ